MKSRCLLSLLALMLAATPAFAQNLDLDARRIAIGGTGTSDNPAQGMVPQDQSYNYHAIVLPFGLVQLWQNRHVFDPNAPEYNPVLAMEYVASPLHFIVNRAANDTSGPFVTDIVNGVLSRDLNTYRGFAFPASLTGAGLLAPHWGGTIKGRVGRNGAYQGLYLAVGPYISVSTDLATDPKLVSLLASTTPTYLPNSSFGIANTSETQLAGAVTIGYRGRFALQAPTSSRDGIYVAANYNYLHGFRHDLYVTNVRFNTDAAGLVTVLPTTAPVGVERFSSTSGSGYSVDFGVSVVKRGWDAGIGVSGVANQITWDVGNRDSWTLASLTAGGDFVHSGPSPESYTRKITLPRRATGNVGYTGRAASIQAEIAHGLQGYAFNGGLEYRMKALALRGGGRYVKSTWHGAAGVGLNFSRRVGLDVAAYGTSANLEQLEKLALAVSLRINAGRKK